MIKEIKYFVLACDNCGAYWADNVFEEDKEVMGDDEPVDDSQWFTALQKAEYLQDAVDEDVKWYTDERETETRHYCPQCWHVTKGGELLIMLSRSGKHKKGLTEKYGIDGTITEHTGEKDDDF